MEKEKTLITLPTPAQMLEKLLTVNNEPHLQQKFYPILLQHAGKQIYASAINIILATAIFDYTQGLPPVMTGILMLAVPKYIRALISDEQGQKEALELYEAAQNDVMKEK